jgi:hypothetical protein
MATRKNKKPVKRAKAKRSSRKAKPAKKKRASAKRYTTKRASPKKKVAAKNLDEEKLKEGLATLKELAKSEYRHTLEDLLRDPQPGVDPSLQIARLVGVLMKEPFAKPEYLPQPSNMTGAYRKWELLDKQSFKLSDTSSWQYLLLQNLASETGDPDVYTLAKDAHHESGFFGRLAHSTAKYICGDPIIQKGINKAVEDMKKSGMTVTVTSPDVAVGSAGLSLGMYLIQHVPILGFAGAPVIAAFILILYRIGVDAFCNWPDSPQVVNTPLERN